MRAEIKAVERIASEIIPRGWEFDRDHSSDEFLTWYYPPSGVELDDGSLESVTRIWLDDPDEPHVILVGSGKDADDIMLTVEQLFARLAGIEAYRFGERVPDLV